MLIIALIVGTLISFFLGYLWYGPLFGNLWNTAMGFTSEEIAVRKSSSMGIVVGLNILSQVVIAIVTYTVLHLLGVTTVIGAMEIMFLVWIGFSLPITLEPILWDKKPWIIFCINGSYRIVSYICIALALIVIAH